MSATPRPRRQITEARLRLMRPLLRYSYSRDAYVLRVVGSQMGRVYQVAADKSRSETAVHG